MLTHCTNNMNIKSLTITVLVLLLSLHYIHSSKDVYNDYLHNYTSGMITLMDGYFLLDHFY